MTDRPHFARTLTLTLAVLLFASTAWARGGQCLNKPNRDCDGDGLINSVEANIGTSPLNPDTDNDGLSDGDEHLTYGTDPLDADTDDDWLNDGDEVALGTDPFDDDTDGDWLKDGAEVNTWGSDPLLADTDGEGFLDNYEAFYGTNPTNPDTDGDGVIDGVDCFPFDPAEWDDRDDDGIGDNADGTNIIDDVREVVGGQSLSAGTTFPATFDLIFCPSDTVGQVSLNNPNCEDYSGIPMDATLIAGQVEWDEWLDANGVWNFRWAGPTIAHSSMRLVGPRIQPLPGYSTCYEGELQFAGGGTDFSRNVTWYYFFQSGQFSICIY